MDSNEASPMVGSKPAAKEKVMNETQPLPLRNLEREASTFRCDVINNKCMYNKSIQLSQYNWVSGIKFLAPNPGHCGHLGNDSVGRSGVCVCVPVYAVKIIFKNLNSHCMKDKSNSKSKKLND